VLDKVDAIYRVLEAGPCRLDDLGAATGLPRATAHRLAVALERLRMVARDGDGRFVLGPRLADLARAAGSGRRRLADAAGPALTRLRDATGESTQLYVPAGESRVCLVSLESPFSLRTIVPVGAALAMDRGSAAAALRGDVDVLRRGWAESVEEREKGVASVSAPVVVDGSIVAAVSVSGPLERTTRSPGSRYASFVMEAARAVERAVA
jgi:DNA-binding IclR family transcriptional regulator